MSKKNEKPEDQTPAVDASEELVYSTEDRELAEKQQRAGNLVVSVVRVNKNTKKYTFKLPINKPLPIIVRQQVVGLGVNQTNKIRVAEEQQNKGNQLKSIVGTGKNKVYTFANPIN